MAVHPPPRISDETRFARRAIVSLWAVVGALALATLGSAAAGAAIVLAPSASSGYAIAEVIEGVTAVLALVACLPSLILWLIWYAAAVSRLPALGIAPRQSPGASVVWWFVPIANLFMPKRTTNDLWRSGDPSAPASDPSWLSRPVAGVVHWWWAAYVVLQLLNGATFAWIPDGEDSRAELLGYYVAAGVTWLLATAIALLSLWITREIDARQQARLTWLHGHGGRAH